MRPRTGDDRGFALMAALWLVVILAVVGLEFALETKAITGRVMAARDHSVALAAAQGGVELAGEVLTQRIVGNRGSVMDGASLPDPWWNPGRLLEDTLEVGNALVRVSLEDAGTKLNLNLASETEFRRLMSALRIDDSDADRLTQAILDWRDPDRDRRSRGAEAEEYEGAGKLRPPDNGPFASVEDLAYVLGMAPETLARLAPFLTVEGSGRVNLRSAPEEVLWTIPGMTQSLLGQIVRARGRRGIVSLHAILAGLDPFQTGLEAQSLAALLSRVSDETEEVIITSEGWLPGSPVRVTVGALAVRSGTGAFLVDRGIR